MAAIVKFKRPRGPVVFPATQAPSSDANTLDDYEEGTTTPTPTPAAGAFTSVSATLYYTKIGRQVFVTLSIGITTVGTASGAITCALPFTAAAGAASSCVGRENGVSGKLGQGTINGSASSITNITYYDGTSMCASGAVIHLMGHYRV